MTFGGTFIKKKSGDSRNLQELKIISRNFISRSWQPCVREMIAGNQIGPNQITQRNISTNDSFAHGPSSAVSRHIAVHHDAVDGVHSAPECWNDLLKVVAVVRVYSSISPYSTVHNG